MGALTRVVNRMTSVVPERKTTVGNLSPTWEVGVPQSPKYVNNYWRNALEGYSRNEVVYACFPAGTPVVLADGRVQPIEDVAVGSCMRTHRGNRRLVEEIISRPYIGSMVTIKRAGRTTPIECTGNHQLYIARGNRSNLE